MDPPADSSNCDPLPSSDQPPIDQQQRKSHHHNSKSSSSSSKKKRTFGQMRDQIDELCHDFFAQMVHAVDLGNARLLIEEIDQDLLWLSMQQKRYESMREIIKQLAAIKRRREEEKEEPEPQRSPFKKPSPL